MSEPLTSKKLAIEALEHVEKVFKSMADRGRYPSELLPYIEGEPNQHYLGKQGWEFLTDALNALRLGHEPQSSASKDLFQFHDDPDVIDAIAARCRSTAVVAVVEMVNSMQASAVEIRRLQARIRELEAVPAHEPPALPTFTCPNCETKDEFSVRHDTVEDDGPRGSSPVAPVVTCHVCLQDCRATLRGDESRIDLPPVATSPPCSRRRPSLDESNAWQAAEDERDWWRDYALELEERHAQPPPAVHAEWCAAVAQIPGKCDCAAQPPPVVPAGWVSSMNPALFTTDAVEAKMWRNAVPLYRSASPPPLPAYADGMTPEDDKRFNRQWDADKTCLCCGQTAARIAECGGEHRPTSTKGAAT